MRNLMVISGSAFAFLLSWRLATAAEDSKVAAPPDFVAPRQFSWDALASPESLFWPGFFWAWNGPLEPDVLRRQLVDMAAHDARSVCTLPMPHEFRPTVMNNLLEPGYLSPEFFARVKIAVDEAARLRMNYWLYDEGGWPSGQATGRVLQARPDVATRVLVCDADGKWTPRRQQHADLLNPRTAETFLKLTHDRYADAVGNYFGSAIKLAFTDEPAYASAQPGRAIPWPEGAEAIFRRRFGYDALQKLDAMRVTKPQDLTPAQKQVRIDLFDFWSGQFRDAYFLPLRDWSRRHGLAQAGHLGGEDETFGAVRYGYGHIMRQLRALDVPGVDVIWRQVFPGKANHHFPKFASSAAHQNCTALAFTESYCVYGDGITPAQMKWILDYQYVRGLTLLVCGVYPLSTCDHLMTGERPHFDPSSPLADFLPDFYRYVARLGYTLSCGRPAVEIGLYYPVRDLWASGDPSDPALRGHDALAQALLERQCDFDIVDDDVLGDPSTRVEGGRLAIGPMRYRTIVLGPTHWMSDAAQRQLKTFQAAGGQVVRVEDLNQVDAVLKGLTPTVKLDPPSPDLRVAMRRWPGGGAAFLFNEGQKAYRGAVSLALDGTLREVEPARDIVRAVSTSRSSGGAQTVPLELAAGESMLWVAGPENASARVAPAAVGKTAQTLDLADGWTARVERRYVTGEHDYEVQQSPHPEFKPAKLGPWATGLGLDRDFSGQATYRRTVRLPEEWRGGRLLLDLGGAEYAARVSIDGRGVGCVLWSPWRIELPPLGDRREFTLEIEVANTLANELTSARVRQAWAKRTGPGWPSCYHQRALDFEQDSRGGGLLGPVRLELAAP